MNQVIERDILDITEGVIGHQVNCMGVMGGGLALQIKQRYPQVFHTYAAKRDWILGDCQIVEVDPRLYIANLAGQYDFGRDKQYTDEFALESAIRPARDFADANGFKLYLPYMIGCGLGGGNWDYISERVAEVAPDAIICKLPE